ncbi:hypothetical protein NPIL_611301 [Nephila pilipes]|uniref:Uncharacterized protein n=1 Tax=Nephila pilipes TaxID=299642 RepID=A0A8X6PQR3_NEPPI|nr:hypothetical protein NPIL_611301 [Nephila pilipes]
MHRKIAKLYKWNRRRCSRNIVQPNSDLPSYTKFRSFSNNWSPPRMVLNSYLLTLSQSPPVDLLSQDSLHPVFQGCENSAPGPDLMPALESVDPRCFILSKF